MKDQRFKPFLLCLFAYFCVGSLVMTGNTVMKSIIAEYNWTDTQGSMLITFMSAGFLVSSLFGNLVMDAIGRGKTVLLGGLIMAGSYLLFVLIPVPVLFYPLLFIAGLAWGGLNSLVNTVVTEMYDGNNSRLNMLHACFAIGATLFPLLVGFMTKSGLSWRVPAALIIVLGVLLMLAGSLIRLP